MKVSKNENELRSSLQFFICDSFNFLNPPSTPLQHSKLFPYHKIQVLPLSNIWGIFVEYKYHTSLNLFFISDLSTLCLLVVLDIKMRHPTILTSLNLNSDSVTTDGSGGCSQVRDRGNGPQKTRFEINVSFLLTYIYVLIFH